MSTGVAAIAVLGLTAGCGIGSGTGPDGAAEAGSAGAGGRAGEGKDERQAVKVLTGNQLRHVELGAQEVPGFLVEKASPGTAGGGLPETDREPCRPLVVALGSQPQPEPVASVVDTFARAARDQDFDGLMGTIRVSRYDDDGARTTLRELRGAAEECADGFRMTTGEGQPQEFEAVRVLPAPALGDEAVAYGLVNAAEEAPSLVTVVRTGDTLSMFFVTNLADPDRVEIPGSLVAAQVAKVEGLERAERPPTAPPSRPGAEPWSAEGGEAGEDEDDEGEE
ncbi:hypothetical protein BLA24_14870 [Streptomyces cinnamoneus]|uniref:Sensor domain-containing protein n=1 Tax=Streptomyces cinnamoneus TaxID=53446 RepID=A0A2G1XIN2_STRCJ|nr:hypothetical protein BLA24_14870 [Streptomyces cinnamoneus]PPT13717.1 hypothetical protein CYQ11_13200 [Streptomyces cinnamoneus]